MVTSVKGRRNFMKSMVALTASAGLVRAPFVRAQSSQRVPHSTGMERPDFLVPALACDCHMHIYDSRYPVDPKATLRPADARVSDYRLLQRRLGLTRNVVVTPSTYGTDNRCMLDALSQLGANARGIAVVDTRIKDQELKQLADLGVRGIRFNLTQGGATTIDMMADLAKRIAPLGWHVQLNMKAGALAVHEKMLLGLPSGIVIDHMGHIPVQYGVHHPGYQTIRKLLDQGKTWVKLSGAYLESKTGAPDYADVTELGRAFVQAAPERLVWGSDWPHPTVAEAHKPNDAGVMNLLARWAPNENVRNRILVLNPETLYGFPHAAI